MVLELTIPKTPDWAGLAEEWPTFVTYIISFFFIYRAWHSHHNVFNSAKVITPRAFFFNYKRCDNGDYEKEKNK